MEKENTIVSHMDRKITVFDHKVFINLEVVPSISILYLDVKSNILAGKL